MEVGHEQQTILVYRVLAVGLVRICQHSLLLRSARYLVRQMKTPQEIAIDINKKLMAKACGGRIGLAEVPPLFDGRQALLPWGHPRATAQPKLRNNHKWHAGPMNSNVAMLVRQERLTHRMALADDHWCHDEIEHCLKCRITRARFSINGHICEYVYVDDDCGLITSDRPSCRRLIS